MQHNMNLHVPKKVPRMLDAVEKLLEEEMLVGSSNHWVKVMLISAFQMDLNPPRISIMHLLRWFEQGGMSCKEEIWGGIARDAPSSCIHLSLVMCDEDQGYDGAEVEEMSNGLFTHHLGMGLS
ncbi:hypothetical protein Tco_1090704 [Tanacetum coccineum]|uniref:Uncharacterized protein n=1 Tax=Tanacetum coccineum TaxID=301880 RepID=A0ABQ5I618_9ASTR